MLPDSSVISVHSLVSTVSYQHALLTVVAAVLTWGCLSAFYNVYLHPLARFPGPKLAAASKYWLFYQEFIRGASLSDIRDELHSQYGEPILVFQAIATPRHSSPLLATLRHPLRRSSN